MDHNNEVATLLNKHEEIAYVQNLLTNLSTTIGKQNKAVFVNREFTYMVNELTYIFKSEHFFFTFIEKIKEFETTDSDILDWHYFLRIIVNRFNTFSLQNITMNMDITSNIISFNYNENTITFDNMLKIINIENANDKITNNEGHIVIIKTLLDLYKYIINKDAFIYLNDIVKCNLKTFKMGHTIYNRSELAALTELFFSDGYVNVKYNQHYKTVETEIDVNLNKNNLGAIGKNYIKYNILNSILQLNKTTIIKYQLHLKHLYKLLKNECEQQDIYINNIYYIKNKCKDVTYYIEFNHDIKLVFTSIDGKTEIDAFTFKKIRLQNSYEIREIDNINLLSNNNNIIYTQIGKSINIIFVCSNKKTNTIINQSTLFDTITPHKSTFFCQTMLSESVTKLYFDVDCYDITKRSTLLLDILKFLKFFLRKFCKYKNNSRSIQPLFVIYETGHSEKVSYHIYVKNMLINCIERIKLGNIIKSNYHIFSNLGIDWQVYKKVQNLRLAGYQKNGNEKKFLGYYPFFSRDYNLNDGLICYDENEVRNYSIVLLLHNIKVLPINKFSKQHEVCKGYKCNKILSKIQILRNVEKSEKYF